MFPHTPPLQYMKYSTLQYSYMYNVYTHVRTITYTLLSVVIGTTQFK